MRNGDKSTEIARTLDRDRRSWSAKCTFGLERKWYSWTAILLDVFLLWNISFLQRWKRLCFPCFRFLFFILGGIPFEQAFLLLFLKLCLPCVCLPQDPSGFPSLSVNCMDACACIYVVCVCSRAMVGCRGPAPADPGYSKERRRRRRSGNHCLIKC